MKHISFLWIALAISVVLTVCFNELDSRAAEQPNAPFIDHMDISSDTWCEVVLKPTGELVARGNPDWWCEEVSIETTSASYDFFGGPGPEVCRVTFDLEGRIISITWIVTDEGGPAEEPTNGIHRQTERGNLQTASQGAPDPTFCS